MFGILSLESCGFIHPSYRNFGIEPICEGNAGGATIARTAGDAGLVHMGCPVRYTPVEDCMAHKTFQEIIWQRNRAVSISRGINMNRTPEIETLDLELLQWLQDEFSLERRPWSNAAMKLWDS